MCTSGIVRAEATEVESLGFKTLDGGPSIVWHGVTYRPGGLRALGVGTTGRPGINSGVNEAGVGLMLSYLDNCDARPLAADDATTWEDDLRWVANAEALSHCTSAVDMAEFFTRYFETNPSIGGNHLIFDASGTLLGLEHKGGQVRVENYTKVGWTARGNDNLLLDDNIFSNLSEPVHNDRQLRREVATSAAEESMHYLEKGDKLAAIVAIQDSLGRHVGDGGSIGSVCAHGVVIPGGRSPSSEPYFTSTGIIIDARERTMIFSDGNPCRGMWHTLSLAC